MNPRETKRVAVFGAGGRLGNALVNAFSRAGWAVRAQLRPSSKRPLSHWPTEVGVVSCDALDERALCRVAQGVDVVVNALNPLYTAWPRQARRLGQNALSAARSSGALLMFPGTMYNFGRTLPEVLDEGTAQIANTQKARIRIEMEGDMYRAAADGLDSVVLRAGDFLGGCRRGTWFDMAIIKDLAKGEVVYPGPMDRIHTWAYLPDLAQTFVRMAERRNRLQGFHVYHFPGYAITGDELHQSLQRVLGRGLRLRRLPWWQLQCITPFSAMARAVIAMRYLWWRPHRLSGTRLQEFIGSVPLTPLDEAMQYCLRDLDCMPDMGVTSHA